VTYKEAKRKKAQYALCWLYKRHGNQARDFAKGPVGNKIILLHGREKKNGEGVVGICIGKGTGSKILETGVKLRKG